MERDKSYDVAIIGAGPVGLFAIFECGMLGLECAVIDSLETIGGQCSALYPEKPIYDIPAFPEVEAASLIRHLEKQAAPFTPDYYLSQQVQKLEPVGEDAEPTGYTITTSAGNMIHARAIIIAAGAGAFGPNRPPLEGLEAYEGKSVFYAIRSRAAFTGKDIVISGGGDTALDWAIALCDQARTVKLVHRRDKFRAAPDSVRQMKDLAQAGRIELVVPYQLRALHGEDGTLTGVDVATLEGEVRHLKADILLPFFGLSMDLGPIAEWGFELEQRQIVVDPQTCSTTIPGIFAIGDIVTYRHKLKLILTGFAEAAQAAHAAYRRIYPDSPLHFEYSTTKGVPGAAGSAC